MMLVADSLLQLCVVHSYVFCLSCRLIIAYRHSTDTFICPMSKNITAHRVWPTQGYCLDQPLVDWSVLKSKCRLILDSLLSQTAFETINWSCCYYQTVPHVGKSLRKRSVQVDRWYIVSFWVSIDEGVPLRKNGISGDNRLMIRAFETCVCPIVEHGSVEMRNWTIIEKLQRRFTKTLNGVNKS